MYRRYLFKKYFNSIHNILGRLGAFVISCIIITSLLLSGAIGLLACDNSELDSPLYIPPEYLNCIELTPQKLNYYYFDYNPIYFWLPEADEILTGRAVIMKNIEITEEMVRTRFNSSIKIAENIVIEPLYSVHIAELEAGEVVDILGFCRGISSERSAVIIDRCFIEDQGRIGLPLEGTGSEDLFDY